MPSNTIFRMEQMLFGFMTGIHGFNFCAFSVHAFYMLFTLFVNIFFLGWGGWLF